MKTTGLRIALSIFACALFFGALWGGMAKYAGVAFLVILLLLCLCAIWGEES